ncbi:polysaccharide deacetylase family protein [Glycomyces sp. A-F 0318]|uniref:polysaccharide deacetylase family protein n=1 Tax=Glycomyces amatae TaxID=2881355 RepID=UPI001E5B38E2|nr:polysaccharide deacetylase family protein [Glycomyces amatae]MCD0447329.1 polysaccharide deacetylase family protein [Glycomyces amatae]
MRSRMRKLIATLSALVVAVGTAAVVIAAAASPAQAQNCNGYVALTYDDGPNPGTTSSLLNALTSNGLRATMFNTGQRVSSNPSLARAQVDAGMWVANHSWSHPHMTQLSSSQMAQEISSTQQAIQQATGVTPNLFRPPYGETNATLKSVEAQYGLTEVIWSVDSQDWNGASTAQIVQAARSLQNGGVILMHDAYQNTINAVPQIAADLRSRGLCAGMISPTTGRAVAPDGSGGGNDGGGGDDGGGTGTDLLRSGSAGKCIDVPGGRTDNGTKVQLYSCYEGVNQQFTYTAAQELRILGKCLEAPSGGNGTQVQISTCNSAAGQKWTFGSDGSIRSVGYANACLDVYSSSNGAPVQLYSCWGGDNQKWTRA